ncbi:MAG: HEAT repeat domain-containing protein, partial [Sphingobacteriales bacterium]
MIFLPPPEVGAAHRVALSLARRGSFASVQDTTVLPFLAELFTDTEPAVRNATAFAMGQTGGKAAREYLAEAIEKEPDQAVLATMLEAYGKVTNAAGIKIFEDNATTDSTALAGLQWGIYRAGTRGITNQKITEQTISRLQPQNAYQTRLAAAHTLARTPGIDLSAYERTLLPLAQTEPSAIIRSTLIAALGKIKSPKLASVLAAVAGSDKDYRVRIAAVKAMGKLPYAEVKEALEKALTDAHEQVALTAAEVILANGSAAEAKNIAASAEAAQNWRVRAVLLQAALRYTPPKEKTALRKSIQGRYQRSANNYEKGFLLKAMAEDLESFLHISDVALNTQNPVLSTYAVEALTEMRTKENFPEGLKTIF